MHRLTGMAGAAALAVLLADGAAATDSGWSVRICRGQTEASAIDIEVEEGKVEQKLVSWKSDNPQTDFAVPAPLATAKALKVEADSEPDDGKVALCVFWNGAPARTMTFTDELEVTVAQGATDDSCPCK